MYVVHLTYHPANSVEAMNLLGMVPRPDDLQVAEIIDETLIHQVEEKRRDSLAPSYTPHRSPNGEGTRENLL